jgi:hypothetical protein
MNDEPLHSSFIIHHSSFCLTEELRRSFQRLVNVSDDVSNVFDAD